MICFVPTTAYSNLSNRWHLYAFPGNSSTGFEGKILAGVRFATFGGASVLASRLVSSLAPPKRTSTKILGATSNGPQFNEHENRQHAQRAGARVIDPNGSWRRKNQLTSRYAGLPLKCRTNEGVENGIGYRRSSVGFQRLEAGQLLAQHRAKSSYDHGWSRRK